jgi:predicted Zn-dependent protease
MVLSAIGLVAGLVGCASFQQLAGNALQSSGVVTADQLKTIKKNAQVLEKTFEDITPEQEYYIGRSVAATVFGAYKPFDNDAMNRYLNELGQSLAQASDRPETFGGYHFYLLATDEINAFSAPGGLILISRGMVRCCTSEEQLAAVLSHEIGHVEKQHGLKAIRKGRLTSALTMLATEGAKSYGGAELAKLTETFEGSITDITSTMMNSGYSRSLETEADKAAVTILKRAGYDPYALVTMLRNMKTKLKPDSRGFAKTHPDPEQRIASVKGLVGSGPVATGNPVRQKRFIQALGTL